VTDAPEALVAWFVVCVATLLGLLPLAHHLGM
jgi:hypothetical protein